MNSPVTRTPGRTWAYAGLIFGAAGSVAANVGHAVIPPENAPKDWQPQLGAVAWGVAVAVALLISVEVLARVDWPDTFGWCAVRYAGGGVVGLVAAAASYLHLSDLLALWHESEVIVTGGPAIVDGLMVLCSFALMAPTRSAEESPDQSGGTHAAAVDTVGSTGSGQSTPTGSPDGGAPTAIPSGPDQSTGDASFGRVDQSGRGSGLQSTGSGRPGRVDGSTQSGGQSGRRSGRRGRGNGRSDDDLRMELTRAQQMGRLAMSNPSAESIRKELRVGIEKARQLRDELTQEPAARVGQEGG